MTERAIDKVTAHFEELGRQSIDVPEWDLTIYYDPVTVSDKQKLAKKVANWINSRPEGERVNVWTFKKRDTTMDDVRGAYPWQISLGSSFAPTCRASWASSSAHTEATARMPPVTSDAMFRNNGALPTSTAKLSSRRSSHSRAIRSSPRLSFTPAKVGRSRMAAMVSSDKGCLRKDGGW